MRRITFLISSKTQIIFWLTPGSECMSPSLCPNIQLNFFRYAASVVLALAYGKTTPTSYDDPEVLAINQKIAELLYVSKNSPWLVDKYPILRYFPLPHVRMMWKYHKDEVKLFRSLVEFTRQGLVSQWTCPTVILILMFGIPDQQYSTPKLHTVSVGKPARV